MDVCSINHNVFHDFAFVKKCPQPLSLNLYSFSRNQVCQLRLLEGHLLHFYHPVLSGNVSLKFVLFSSNPLGQSYVSIALSNDFSSNQRTAFSSL